MAEARRDLHADATLSSVRVVWLVFLGALAICATLGVLLLELPRPREIGVFLTGVAAALEVLGWVVGIVAMGAVGYWLLDRRRLTRMIGRADRPVRTLLIQHAIVYGLALVPALAGIILVALRGDSKGFLYLLSISLVALLTLYPRRRDLNALLVELRQ